MVLSWQEGKEVCSGFFSVLSNIPHIKTNGSKEMRRKAHRSLGRRFNGRMSRTTSTPRDLIVVARTKSASSLWSKFFAVLSPPILVITGDNNVTACGRACVGIPANREMIAASTTKIEGIADKKGSAVNEFSVLVIIFANGARSPLSTIMPSGMQPAKTQRPS